MDPKPYEPYVPADTRLREFTRRAVVLGVVMAVILGAANAYIGMVAGLTIAATFPAAVVAMALLRPMGGSILEENLARIKALYDESERHSELRYKVRQEKVLDYLLRASNMEEDTGDAASGEPSAEDPQTSEKPPNGENP